MISTAVFAVVLLLMASAIVQVGRMFYKGTIINRTQDATRAMADDVTQAIQFGTNSTSFYQTGAATFSGANVKSYCFGQVRYSYRVDRPLGSDPATQSLHVLWKDRISATGACTPLDITQSNPPGSSTEGQEMLGDNMRIPVFTIADPAGGVGLWGISIIISYGDTDGFVPSSNFTQCQPLNIGGQYCAVSTINTKVVKRL
jgi:hypothetical protein